MKPTRKRLVLEQLESRQLLAAVSIAGNLNGQVGALISVPVAIDSAVGVRGATIRVNYDASVLTLSQENVTAGSAWSSATDTQITTNVNQTTGAVVVFLSASTDLTSTSSSLVQLGFVVRAGATVGTNSTIDLAEVRLNEGEISVNPLPIPGADSTDGSINIVSGTADGLAQIAGFVFADSNQDFLVSSFEGISGASVTLVNVGTGVSQQTTTDADGRYQFTNLTPGNYRIEQTQPNAFIDGGQNQLVVTLSASQSLTSQDFREIGLKPAFISNRLLTTLVMPVGSDNWQSSISRIIQLADSTQSFNSLSTASVGSDSGSGNFIENQVLPLQTMSSLPVTLGEGEKNQVLNSRNLASQASTSPVPQLTRRTKVKGDTELVDDAMASLPGFE